MKKKSLIPIFLFLFLTKDIFAAKTMTEVAEQAEEVYKSMSENEEIEADEDSERKIANMKQKASRLDEERADSLDGAAEGLSKVIDGIESGSWVDIVTGSLDIVAAIAMFGGPYGLVASTVLSFISTCIGLFGGTSESTEDMIGRVMEKKLREARIEDFKGKVRGVKAILTDIKVTLKQVRKDNTTFPEEEFDNLKTLNVQGIDLSARMKTFIEGTCKVTISSKKRKKEKKSERRSNNEVDTALCMNAIDIFGDLSLMRQVLYTDLATAAAGVGDKNRSALFLKQVENLQQEDKQTLRFLRDPMNFRAQRAVFAQFYTRWYKYKTLSVYMKKLNRIPQSKRSAPTPVLFACDEKNLQGSCRLFRRFGRYKADEMQGWSDKIVSFFIGDGYAVRGFHLDDMEGTEFGPYYGPAVIGKAYKSEEWASMHIQRTREQKEMITACRGENLDPEDVCEQIPQNSELETLIYWRQDFSPKASTRRRFKCKENCFFRLRDESIVCKTTDVSTDVCVANKDLQGNINSLYIPKGQMLSAYEEPNFEGTRYGPFVGPFVLKKVRPEGEWKSLRLTDVDFSSAKMITFCSEQKMSGVCNQILPPTSAGEVIQFQTLNTYQGINWNNDHLIYNDIWIHSMKIPRGLEVEVFDDTNFEGASYGPYTGPVTVDPVDCYDGCYIRSMKVRKIY